MGFNPLPGHCLDDQALSTDRYTPSPQILKTSASPLEETLHTHLLKTNCPITHQPDWASLLIHYSGPQIHRHSLLRYIISYRQHADFHEHCVERIFIDILQYCRPARLSLQAFYLRRGGIDINPFRSNWQSQPTHYRMPHQ